MVAQVTFELAISNCQLPTAKELLYAFRKQEDSLGLVEAV
jgi:hypothetical protein